MDIFTALAEPTRRSIIEMLAQKGELSATDISDKFNSSPPAISQHLRVLREANLVYVEKRSRQRIYQINPSAMNELEEWAKQTTEMWNQRLSRLDKVLEAEKRKIADNKRKEK
jgi:DNA-binding transcriptional ArsR family regulator